MHILKQIVLTTCLCILHCSTFSNAQFGVHKNNDAASTETVTATAGDSNNNNARDGLNLENNPDLAAAIDMFAELSNLSTEEMDAALQEIKEIYGTDAEGLAQIEEVFLEIAKLDQTELEDTMNEIMTDQELRGLMEDSYDETLDMLHAADDSEWKKVLENKDSILETVISTGQISDEEVELFRNNPEKWEEELRLIWGELKREAEEYQETKAGGEEL
mmetsp:Transcript_9553/g.14066  ORF Transcript_9553/g.14066 Transcript_9553/m.14066 type:complete len:218 (+) Transcript_9553:60-713(+)|eukprot:CAMPEP_0197249616 /NCGR_PEP_ID=MMETSP1429-20130617/48314_1 /TAXON_ID=49237 /ORGANISM="Chaetoceros  sp., Strain UNC1202" /LENGTH=217 /DNA_ID=CAMNT_0042711199 /DNA_START=26 /DNA_END=679 /DNA_ORIENTATION=-